MDTKGRIEQLFIERGIPVTTREIDPIDAIAGEIDQAFQRGSLAPAKWDQFVKDSRAAGHEPDPKNCDTCATTHAQIFGGKSEYSLND